MSHEAQHHSVQYRCHIPHKRFQPIPPPPSNLVVPLLWWPRAPADMPVYRPQPPLYPYTMRERLLMLVLTAVETVLLVWLIRSSVSGWLRLLAPLATLPAAAYQVRCVFVCCVCVSRGSARCQSVIWEAFFDVLRLLHACHGVCGSVLLAEAVSDRLLLTCLARFACSWCSGPRCWCWAPPS
jgi:hypothetical protein